jgi:hypothetical protein
MICLEVHRNNVLLTRAGMERASLISAHVGAFIGDEEPAAIHVAGMCDLDEGRSAHVYWMDFERLVVGDVLTFQIVPSEVPSPYLELKPTDSPEYVEEQAEFAELKRNYKPTTEPAVRKWSSLGLDMSLNGQEVGRASYATAEEHILCSVDWNRWRPERLRVLVRSFGGAPDALERPTEWLRVNLQKGEVLELRLDA